jgi:hypothetical protein
MSSPHSALAPRKLTAGPLVDGGSVHSEGPIWDRHHGVVRWVDTFAGDDLERGMLRRSDVGLHLGALANDS